MNNNVTMRSIDSLIEYATNPREIGNDAVDKLSAIVHEFGFRVPIIAMELDPRYCDVIVRRWQGFTGKTATNEATGEAFGG